MARQEDVIRKRFVWLAGAVLGATILVTWPSKGWLAYDEGRDSIAAFHLAKAGVDRAVWEIEQGRVPPDRLLKGEPLPGLDEDRNYRDVPGGRYRVRARYNPSTREFHVIGTGREDTTGRERSLYVVLRKQPNAERLRQVAWTEIWPGGEEWKP